MRPRTSRSAWRAVLALGVALGAAGGPCVAGDDPAPAPAPVDPKKAKEAFDADKKAFVEKVNAAIDRGQEYLLKAQRPEGTWTPRKDATLEVDAYGAQALVLTALAKTGVRATHPKMALGLKVLNQMIVERRGQQRYVGIQPGHRTYAAACTAMCLDALYVEHPRSEPGEGGPSRVKDGLPPDARDQLKDIVTFFVRSQRESIWRYPNTGKEQEDLSATQYALMGLVTAERVGIHAPPEVYRKALRRILEWQETKADPSEDLVPLYLENPVWDPTDRYPRWIVAAKVQARGWSYMGKGPVTGSMTCAGISCLAIVKDRLKDPRLKPPQLLTKEEERRIDSAMNAGIAWLSKSFTVTENPGKEGWHYYYLYGMERAASLIGLGNIGPHDWYREAAQHLIEKQAADGSWPREKDVHVQTAFALLVLKRATVPTSYGPPPVTGGGDDAPTDNGPAGGGK